MTPIIIGVLALFLAILSPIIGIILSIIGIIIGALGIKGKDIKAIIGLVLSILALPLAICMLSISTKSVTRTIDNSRKDSFAHIAQTYLLSINNKLSAEEIECSETASEDGSNQFTIPTSDGDYYLFISSGENTILNEFGDFNSEIANKASEQTIMEGATKSPWGNSDVYGYVHWKREDKQHIYYISLVDIEGHGIVEETELNKIRRENVEIKDAKSDITTALNNINNQSVYYCHYK